MSAYLSLPADNRPELTDMLLDAIKAKNELEKLWCAVQMVAADGSSAKTLLDSMFVPMANELDVSHVAEMIQVLHALPIKEDK